MKNGKILLPLIAFFCSTFASLSAQNYFQSITPGDISDPVAVSKLNRLLSYPEYTQHALVSLGSFEDQLHGGVLSMVLPNGTQTTDFATLNAYAQSNGDYIWIGNNADLGYLSFSRINGQVQADLPGDDGEQRYKLIGLNESQGVLLSKAPLAPEAEGCTAGNEEISPGENEGNVSSANYALPRVASCPNNEIRILYLYTTKAEACGFSADNVAEEVTAMLNAAIGNSGVSGFSFTTAAVELLEEFEEGEKPNKAEAQRVQDDPEAINLRNQWKADLVLLLGEYVESDALFGFVIDIKTSKENAFAVTKISEAADCKNMVGPHEISHMMGARHQKPINCVHGSDPNFSRAHGFKTKNDFKDILTGFKCSATRRINWSNPEVEHDGEPTGKRRANNAAAVEGHAPTVACFYPEYVDPSTNKLTVSFHGPSFLNSNTTYTWTSSVNGGIAPYTIQWYVSTNGANFSLIHTGTTLTRNSNSLPPGVLTLRCKATDAMPQTATQDRKILNSGFGNGGGGFKPGGNIQQMASSANKKRTTQPVIYPNPTDQDLQILNSTGCQSYEIMNIAGQIIQSGKLNPRTNTAKITLPNQQSGIYWIRLIYSDQQARYLKFIQH
ncbi:MAG: T9SS type A sorting domain-containing protein [Bacteroidota bacterium]